jgi:ring-1,2-phenylacetyl-CoA epoxidase subunit PaaE
LRATEVRLDQITFTVSGIRQETRDTRTFFLTPQGLPGPQDQPRPGGSPITYAPGQFITLLVHHYGKDIRRSFSISSYPPDGHPYLSITVKRKTNGEISRFLLDHIKTGDTLSALPPAGRFTFTPQPGARRDIGFIAAGSGITPILPLVRQVLDSEPFTHVWLLYQNHSEADIIFAGELEELASRHAGRFTLLHFLSAPQARNILPRRLGNAGLEQLVPGLLRFAPSEALFYCCGPEALMRMARFALRVMGFSPDQFRQEHFTVDVLPPVPVLSDSSPKTVILRRGGKTETFTTAYPENILQAALNHHIHLPYSCRGGRCSTCAVRCLSGQVVMSINDVLTDKDIREGWVLTCTGYAGTDLELEI